MKLGDHVRIEINPGETGHGSVVGLKPLKVQIDNIPFDGPWNLHDIVLVKLQPSLGKNFDDFYEPTKLVERKYSMRSVVLYDGIRSTQFRDLTREIGKVGGRCEGWMTPRMDRFPPEPGMIGVAHTPATKIREIAKKHGCSVDSTKVFGVSA